MGELITIVYDEDAVSIRIPLDLLVHAQKWRNDESYDIVDKEGMAKFIIENILDHTNNYSLNETGASDFTVLLDELFTKAYEEGEDWLTPSAYPDDYI